MFPEFEACNTTRSTITEVPFSRYSENPEVAPPPPQKKIIYTEEMFLFTVIHVRFVIL